MSEHPQYDVFADEFLDHARDGSPSVWSRGPRRREGVRHGPPYVPGPSSAPRGSVPRASRMPRQHH